MDVQPSHFLTGAVPLIGPQHREWKVQDYVERTFDALPVIGISAALLGVAAWRRPHAALHPLLQRANRAVGSFLTTLQFWTAYGQIGLAAAQGLAAYQSDQEGDSEESNYRLGRGALFLVSGLLWRQRFKSNLDSIARWTLTRRPEQLKLVEHIEASNGFLPRTWRGEAPELLVNSWPRINGKLMQIIEPASGVKKTESGFLGRIKAGWATYKGMMNTVDFQRVVVHPDWVNHPEARYHFSLALLNWRRRWVHHFGPRIEIQGWENLERFTPIRFLKEAKGDLPAFLTDPKFATHPPDQPWCPLLMPTCHDSFIEYPIESGLFYGAFQVTTVAKQEFFTGSVLSKIMGKAMSAYRFIPLEREAGESAAQGLGRIAGKMTTRTTEGEWEVNSGMLLKTQGTRTKAVFKDGLWEDGPLVPSKPGGLAAIAEKAPDLTVIPVGYKNMSATLPKGADFFFLLGLKTGRLGRTIKINIGEPFKLGDLVGEARHQGKTERKEIGLHLANTIDRRLSDLSGRPIQPETVGKPQGLGARLKTLLGI